MKNTVDEVKIKKQKNPTTNYPKDNHAAFCERCYKHNGCCPNTKTAAKDSNCSI